MDDCIPLENLEVGASGAIAAVVGRGELLHRLDEIGLRPGAEVQMVQAGRPCIVRVNGQRLCLRADELSHVLVRSGVLA
ncbi:MAG TPA: FeoA family protein [Pirellulales bacterium]|nr:FeoA family protein [Pirellulales bacterium]